MSSNRSYTRPADGFLVGPPDAPDEVVDVKEYNRAMEALENADAAATKYKAGYDALLLEVHRLAHLVVVHGSDPATMFGRWAEDESCCMRSKGNNTQ